MASIREATALLRECCALDGRELPVAHLRRLLELLPTPSPAPGFYERLPALWDAKSAN